MLGLGGELVQLLAPHQQLASAQRRVIEDVAVLVGADVGVQQPQLAIFDQAVSIFEIGAAGADSFHLGAGEHHAGFVFFQQKIIMRGGAIHAGITLAAGHGISLDVFWFFRAILMQEVAGHAFWWKASPAAAENSC